MDMIEELSKEFYIYIVTILSNMVIMESISGIYPKTVLNPESSV